MKVKFSIVISVYNKEAYLKRCLDSLLNQSYDNYELIIINDGSTDNSKKILKEYKNNKKITIIHQSNKGVGFVRNKGASKATGDYLLFVDSDDYVDKDYLKIISENLEAKLDILRFQISDVINGKTINHPEKSFKSTRGPNAFKKMTEFKYLDSPVCYCIKLSYYQAKKFKFIEKIYHEDFALIPLLIMKAQTVKCIDSCLYYYVKVDNSIMNYKAYDKTKTKLDDAIKGYKYLIKEIDQTNLDNKDIFKSYISNALLVKLSELKKEDYRYYLKELQKLGIFDNILRDSVKRKIKYYLLKISPRTFLKVLEKK